jgi:hypothetical protein
MNVDRLIVGMATVFGQPGQDGSKPWRAETFADFLALEVAVPLRIDHGPLIDGRGMIDNLGTVRRFAAVTEPVAGLLCVAEIDHAGGYGDSILRDINSILRQLWMPAGWGMSLGAWVTEDIDAAMPYEVSVTRHPAFEDALVLAVGADALNVWELLTETAPDDMAPRGATLGQNSRPDRW